MPTYTTTALDDSNLDVTVTEGEVVTINVTPAAVTVTGAVASVNGQTGTVVLDSDDIDEGTTNLFYSDLHVDNHLVGGTGVTYSSGTISIGQDVGTDQDVTFNTITGDMYGANHLNVKNDEGTAITKGTPVYFKGISGNKITVGVADANDPTKMPAFGIATADANSGANVDIATMGEVIGFDTETPNWSINDSLYVSTDGTLTNTRPTGADDAIQKIARVAKIHASSGILYVMGAGRSNDIPNLATGHVFIGNGSGYEKRALTEADISDFGTYLTSISGTVEGSLIPDTNISYDLGSATNRFRDLYLSGSSIDLGGASITSDGSSVALPSGSTVGGTALSTFSGDYNDLTNQPTIPDAYTNNDVDTHLNSGTAATDDVLKWDGADYAWTSASTLIDNSSVTLDSNGFFEVTSDYSLFGLTLDATGKYRPADWSAHPSLDYFMMHQWYTENGNNTASLGSRGSADDGTHDALWLIHGADNVLKSVTNGSLTTTAPLEIASTTLNLNASDTVSIQNDTNVNGQLVVTHLDNSLPNIARFRREVDTLSNNQESGIEIGMFNSDTFYKIGRVATQYRDDSDYEFKLQVYDPSDDTTFNNLTIRDRYVYSDNPFKMTNYTTTDLGNFTGPLEGMLVWDETAGSLKVYDGSAWSGVGGGGGASSLNDLNDVNTVSLADGDLLRYNGTASEWQNTNLGLSVTPTFSENNGLTFTASINAQFNISNWSSYDDPHVFAEVYNSSGTLVLGNSSINVFSGGAIQFIAPAEGTNYELRVKVQDFGDLASEVAIVTFNTETYGGTYRYWRLTDWEGGDGHTLIREWELWSAAGQTGSNYPSQMTSNTTPTPYVASTDYNYTGYEAWEAFDDNLNNQWWNLGRTGGYEDSYLQIDLGSSTTIGSIKLWTAGFAANSVKLYASNTGAFTGEEDLIDTIYLDINSTFTRG